MKKSVSYFKAGLVSAVLGSLLFFCNVFDSPSAPEKTEISAVFQGSDGKIYDGYFVDSAGKEVGIGAALYLPANFDSIRFEVIDSTTKVIDVTVREFMDDYFRDTVWIRHTFMTAGLKNVTITPFATPERLPVTSRIVVEGSVQNAAPQWSVDTLRRTVKVGSPLFQSLSEICTDRESDVITFALVPGAPDNDTIINSIYQFTPLEQDTGTHIVEITASDPAGNRSSILPVILTIYNSAVEPQSEYRVVYDGNGYTGGTVPADTNKYVTSSTVIVKDNTGFLVKTGLSFAGWNTAADGSGTAYMAGAAFSMGSKDVILYAQWAQPIPFTVTYNGNAHTAGAAPVDQNQYETGTLVTVKSNTGNMVKVGFTFAGWNTSADGSGTAYASGVTFPMGIANVTLYAQWTTMPTFTVTYHGNGNTGGSVPSDANNYITGAVVTAMENVGALVKAEVTFIGWNTAADGSGTSYAPGATFPMGSVNVMLYAQWTSSPTYTVTYDGNGNTGGTVPVDANSYQTAANVTVKGNTGLLEKTGATFTGWNTAADGSGTLYAAGVTFPMAEANVILYALWTTTPSYTITFDSNGGSGTMAAQSIVSGMSAPLTANVFTKSGSVFAGWVTTPAGTTVEYADMSIYSMGNNNVILYALWSQNPSYKVTFISNGGNGTMADQSIVSGMSVPLSANAFTKSGSAFAGWTTSTTGTTVDYTDKAPYTMGGSDVTLYALWSENPLYNITFNSNGGTGTMADQSIVSGMAAPLVANAFVKTGSAFAGWVTTATGTTAEYADKASYTMGNGNVVLYALWSQNPSYTITFNSNGGSGTMAAQSIVSGLSAPLSANTFTKAGSTFAGWVTAATGTSAEYADKAPYTMGNGNVVLYALWSQNPSYTITFNSNGGSGTMAAQLIVSGLSAPLAANTFTNAGSTFAGWNTAAGGNGTPYAAGATFTMGDMDVTLYAQWTVNNVSPSITTQPEDRSVNRGGNISFTAVINTNVHPAPTYIRWVRNNTDTITGATSLTLSLNTVQYSAAGNYKVIVRNSVGTAVSDNAILTVNDVTRPTLTRTGAADTTILLGSTWTDPRGTATDDKDGNIASRITLTGAPANTNTAGRYTITYNVSDLAGNAATSVQRILRIEGWENVATIPESGFNNAVLDGAENIYIASDQIIYKVTNGTALRINTFSNAKHLTVALGTDNTNVFTYATVTGEINKYNGSTWSLLGSIGLNSVQPSSIIIGSGNGIYLLGGYPIFMQVLSVYMSGSTLDGYVLGDEPSGLPASLHGGRYNSKGFCVSSNDDVYTIGQPSDIVAGKYSRSLNSWTFQTLEMSNESCFSMRVVNYGSTGYIGYTKGGDSYNNPTLYQSGNGSNWTKITSSVANNPTQGGGGLDIAVSSAGELHAAYVQGSSMLIKKYVNSSWVTIPNCNTTASFTAAGAQNPYVLPGLDFCYIVYSDASNIYIKKWKKQ